MKNPSAEYRGGCWLVLLVAICSMAYSNASGGLLAFLHAQATGYIAKQPSESSMSVGQILSNYHDLQSKWLGADNLEYNKRQIANNPLFARAGLLANSSLGESSAKITFLRLHYPTQNSSGRHKVAGLLILPARSQKLKGVVLFFHSTISGKFNVPSLRFGDYKSQMLAAVFAANGYIVVCPDYIGLGDDFKTTHPYIIYPEPNIDDGRDMLLATMRYLKLQHLLPGASKLPLYVSGYSEGGSYAMWFSRNYQERASFAASLNSAGLRLGKTVAIEGAYNLTGVMFPFLLSNQVNDSQNHFNIATAFWGTLLKPALLANVILAYAATSHQPVEKFLNSDFYKLQCTLLPQSSCGQDEQNQFNLENYMLTPVKAFKLILRYFLAANLKSADGVIYSPFFNSVRPLMTADGANDKGLFAAASKANILDWKSSNPITLISLASDSLVPEQNSRDAYQGMLAAGSRNLKYLRIDNSLLRGRALFGVEMVDHVGFELYALLIALNEFNTTNRPASSVQLHLGLANLAKTGHNP